MDPGVDGLFQFLQLRQRSLGTDVPCLQPKQFQVCFHRRGDGHEAEEAAGVVGPVLVLGAAVHRQCESPKDSTMLDGLSNAGRDRYHVIVFAGV